MELLWAAKLIDHINHLTNASSSSTDKLIDHINHLTNASSYFLAGLHTTRQKKFTLYPFAHAPADSLGSMTRLVKAYVLKLWLDQNFLTAIYWDVIALYIYCCLACTQQVTICHSSVIEWIGQHLFFRVHFILIIEKEDAKDRGYPERSLFLYLSDLSGINRESFLTS